MESKKSNALKSNHFIFFSKIKKKMFSRPCLLVIVFLLREVAGSLPECNITSKTPNSVPQSFERHGKILPAQFSQHVIHGQNNCTLDISRIMDASCSDKVETVFDVIVICKDKNLTPVITNKQNISCDNYFGALNVFNCSILWHNLEVFGTTMHLYALYSRDSQEL